MTERLYTPNEMAIACAKRLSGQVMPVDPHWTDLIVERGIELADDPGRFTIQLENGQRFELQVVDQSPADKRIDAPGCTGLATCPAEWHAATCLGAWVTEEEALSGAYPGRDVLLERRSREGTLRGVAGLDAARNFGIGEQS